MYEDLAILAEGIVQSVIESEHAVKPILFYDAYRALDSLCLAVYDVVSYMTPTFDFKEESIMIRQREKWIHCMNDELETAFQCSRTFLLKFGAIYCVYENGRHAFSPIDAFSTKNGYFPMIKDDYAGDRVEKGDALILHRNVLIIPDRTKTIDASNELKLGTVDENIDDTLVAKRIQNEGFTSLKRLEKVRDIMETYLAEHISITELFPRWDIWY